MLLLPLATCARASLRVTYLRHILFKFLFDTNKFAPLTIIVRWVKNYLYLGAADASVYCNCCVQEAINATSLNYSLRCNNVPLLSAGRHACTCTCDCFPRARLGWPALSEKHCSYEWAGTVFSLTPISWNSILVYFPVLPNRPFVATWASGVHSSMHACMCTLSLASTKPLITAAIQMRFG